MSQKKAISLAEKKFAQLIVETGCGPILAARQTFNWRCEAGSMEAQRAKDLARSERVVKYMAELNKKQNFQIKQKAAIVQTNKLNVNKLRQYAIEELTRIRDDPFKPARTRMRAMNALTKLADPSEDINLINKWIDIVWRFAEGHCPACHTSFPLWQIYNKQLELWRRDYEARPVDSPSTDLERRLVGISFADNRRRPHRGQVKFLSAPERHLVGLGPARAGKSWFMATLAFLSILLPGSEIWIIARIYESARSEQNYLLDFLKTAFHPFADEMFTLYEDKRSQEVVILTRWGSELRIRSSKSKGAITGRALDVALVAEPAWVPDDLYEELRARMSEKLGRILAFGTPKGDGGFIGRMIRMTGRNPSTGKIIKKTPEERLIKNGSPWNTSMLLGRIEGRDNPEYVTSEMDAARQELTDVEYASEFLGEVRMIEGVKYPEVKDHLLIDIPREDYQHCVYTLGIDQGPRNFGACLVGFNGNDVYVAWEYFDNTVTTMKKNMKFLQEEVRRWIASLGGAPDEDWLYTIIDRNPDMTGIFAELEEESTAWPTDYGTIPVNIRKLNENWRRETSEWANNMAAAGLLKFDKQRVDNLFTQVKDCLDRPINPDKDNATEMNKGWIVKDPWRGDHVMDAWLFALYSIMVGNVIKPEFQRKPGNAWQEAQAAFNYRLRMDEARELKGFRDGRMRVDAAQMFKEEFGRSRGRDLSIGMPGYYQDES